MTEDDPFTDAGPSREYGRVLLVVAAIAAVGLAALFVPVLTSGGAGGGPIGSLVPKPPGATPPGGAGGSGGSLQGGGFGALNPGDSTDIGGDQSAFRDQEPGTHFVVESPQAGYWRTGTYATYTGEGWEREGEARPTDGTIPGGGPSRATVSYTVELKRSAGSLPTMYRPRRVSLAAGSADLSATDAGAVRAAEPLQFGTRYDATSARPVNDPSVLRGAGRDYPDAIEERYTQLPAATRQELSPITERISREAGAETAYGTAAAVERWIRTEKEYSLEVPPPGEDVAVEYVYEMEKGYCEYAATGMVTMLRSQDIPARYVVGYSTGRQVAPDRYQVLSMNAHAWVEVYFPDVGWVRFDPTPPDARRAAEEEAFENQTDMEYEQEATPTPTPTPTPPSDTPTAETPTPTPTPTPDGPAPYRVEFNRSLAPGATVAATVTRDGAVQSGVTVLFNDRRIGRTDATGTVVGEVPYSRNVTVRVSDSATPVEAVVPPPRGVQQRAPPPALPAAGVGRDRSRFPAAGPPAPSPATTWTTQADNGSVAGTYQLPTEGNLSLSGELVTEGEVLLTASVGGTPIRDAAVSVDGEQVTRTNRRGRAVLALPAEPGNVTVTVSRGEISASRNVTLPELTMSVSPSIALPGAPARATVRLGNETAANATVLVAGEPVGSVGPNGTVAFGLPLALAPTVTAEGYGQTAQVTVSGVRTNLALAGLGVLLAAVLTVVVSRRTDTPVRTLLARVVAALRRLPDLFTALVVRAGELLESALGVLLAVPGRALAVVRDLLAGRRTPRQLLAAARAALVGFFAGVRSRATAVRERAAPVTDSETDAPEVTLGDAWRRFLSYVSVREPASRTPGELARHAVETDGLPPDAVRTLRDDYRAVEYGARDPDERLRRVEAALDDVERAVQDARETPAADESDAVAGADEGAPAPDGDDEPPDAGVDPAAPPTGDSDDGGGDGDTGGGVE